MPARLALDTGAFITMLTNRAARRMGLKTTRLGHVKVNFARGLLRASDAPVRLELGTQTIETPVPVLNFPPFVSLKDYDGLVGWPEVRDNILVFDSARRRIYAVSELPSEAADWLKLKIYPASQLILEIPMPDGETGTLVVDTGAPHGISLPPARWQTWRAAHPRAPHTNPWMAMLTMTYMPGMGVRDNDEAWAEEISLGSLTLTDVPLRAANAAELGRRAHPAGTLGLYALERMDLIVDGKSGLAYVRSKPPPGPPYFAIKRARTANPAIAIRDWVLDENLAVRSEHLRAFECLNRSTAKRTLKDDDGALADLDQAIALEPQEANGYLFRGRVKMRTDDYSGALADFDHALALDPRNIGARLLRGWIKILQNDDDGAAADFLHAREMGAGKLRLFLVRRMSRLERWGKRRKQTREAREKEANKEAIPAAATPATGGLDGAIIPFLLVSSAGGGLLWLLQSWLGAHFGFGLILAAMVILFPAMRWMVRRHLSPWVENTGDAGGGRTPFRIVREWTSDMFLWNVLLVWGLRDFNLNGPQRVFWFCATGFAMTSVWYIVLQRLARPPPVRLLKKYPLILLALLGFAALAAWVAVLYFSLSSQLIND